MCLNTYVYIQTDLLSVRSITCWIYLKCVTSPAIAWNPIKSFLHELCHLTFITGNFWLDILTWIFTYQFQGKQWEGTVKYRGPIYWSMDRYKVDLTSMVTSGKCPLKIQSGGSSFVTHSNTHALKSVPTATCQMMIQPSAHSRNIANWASFTLYLEIKKFRIKCRVLFVPYTQAVKWRLNRRSHELTAAGAEYMLHYSLFPHIRVHTTRK